MGTQRRVTAAAEHQCEHREENQLAPVQNCRADAPTTGPRLLTLHNLSYIQRLMADLRDAIDRDVLNDRVAEFMAGAAPSQR